MTILLRCPHNQVRSFSSTFINRSSKSVRVRFAPSPTGSLHLGGLRTAFYNYVFARQNKGRFVLRIEDTDTARTVSGSAEEIERLLEWSGLTPDESPTLPGDFGPYRQSERKDLYIKKAHDLLASGRAYRCFCSSERLDLLRKFQAKNREKTRYDGKCKHLSHEDIKAKLEENQGRYVIRFSLSPGSVSFNDIIYGDIANDLVGSHEGDFVILKSDGLPTYHFANVVDDHAMKISHVMRGSEWISSTVKHVQLYQAFNWEPPKFAHFPLITSGRVKLSKRDNKSRVQSWIEAGYQPRALLNFLTHMGGGVPKQKQDALELWDIDQFIRGFKLDDINRHPASLDLNFLNRYNSKDLIQQWSIDAARVLDMFKSAALNKGIKIEARDEEIRKFLNASLMRINTLNDLLTDDYAFIWALPKLSFSKEQYLAEGWNLEGILKDVIDVLGSISDINEADAFLARMKQLAESNKVNYSQLMQFLRKSLTDRKTGLPVHEIILILGQNRSIEYLNSALSYVAKQSN